MQGETVLIEERAAKESRELGRRVARASLNAFTLGLINPFARNGNSVSHEKRGLPESRLKRQRMLSPRDSTRAVSRI